MIEWRYWRWQILRHAPLGMCVFGCVAAAGLALLQSAPQGFRAESQLVLEAPLALSGSQKAARTAGTVQHLQVVKHGLMADRDPTDESLQLSIQSGRDKPTQLIVRTKTKTREEAMSMAQSTARRAVEISEDLQRDRLDSALAKLADVASKQAEILAAAEDALGAFKPRTSAGAGALSLRLEQLTKRLGEARTTELKPSPEVTKLRQTLADESVLFSDLHPRIKLLKAQIEDAQHAAPKPNTEALEQEIARLTSRLAAAQEDQRQRTVLQNRVAALTSSLARAQDALADAKLSGEAQILRLKLIQDAQAEPDISAKKVLAAQLAIVGLGLAAAGAMIAVRLRMDRHVRRPVDLAKGLGIAPFATLPDLGRSLA